MADTLWLPVLGMLWSLLVVGLFGVVCVGRKVAVADARTLRRKYTSYAIIVHAVALCLLFLPRGWPWVAATLAAAGLLELARAGQRANPRSPVLLPVALTGYALIAAGFLRFAFACDLRTQLFAYVIVCVFDGFSQLAGQLIGRHALAPSISPRKTIEGALGGLAAALLSSLALHHAFGAPWHIFAGKALLICLAALAGDLLGSLLKRRLSIKDFSNLLGPHGGLLDRFGSFFAAGAATAGADAIAPLSSSASHACLVAALACGVLLITELLRRVAHFRDEVTRKLAHIGSGAVALGVPALGVSPLHVLILAIAFMALMTASERGGWLRSVHGARGQSSWGSHTFPMAIMLTYLAYLGHGIPAAYTIPLLMLIVCDSLAALVGRQWPVAPYRLRGEPRTASGSIAFFLSACAILLAVFASAELDLACAAIPACLLAAAALTAVEALTTRGFDNLTVPMAAIPIVFLLQWACT